MCLLIPRLSLIILIPATHVGWQLINSAWPSLHGVMSTTTGFFLTAIRLAVSLEIVLTTATFIIIIVIVIKKSVARHGVYFGRNAQ